jgi:hypothetical protein
VTKNRNLAELVRVLAEIASQTTDADTAQRLMELVHTLMTDAGVLWRIVIPTAAATAGRVFLPRWCCAC